MANTTYLYAEGNGVFDAKLYAILNNSDGHNVIRSLNIAFPDDQDPVDYLETLLPSKQLQSDDTSWIPDHLPNSQALHPIQFTDRDRLVNYLGEKLPS